MAGRDPLGVGSGITFFSYIGKQHLQHATLGKEEEKCRRKRMQRHHDKRARVEASAISTTQHTFSSIGTFASDTVTRPVWHQSPDVNGIGSKLGCIGVQDVPSSNTVVPACNSRGGGCDDVTMTGRVSPVTRSRTNTETHSGFDTRLLGTCRQS